jgi:hypothetical protein
MTSETLEKANEIGKKISRLNIIIEDIKKIQRPLGETDLHIHFERPGTGANVTLPNTAVKERIFDMILQEYEADRTLLQKELSEL